MTAIEFLKRAANGHRIVSSGYLNELQMCEARREGKWFVDEETGLGFALLPWELTTEKDRKREQSYFAAHVKKVLLATDEDSGDEAIYVDDRLVSEDSTLYAVDIANHVKDCTIEVEHQTVLLVDNIFPRDASELKFVNAPTVAE